MKLVRKQVWRRVFFVETTRACVRVIATIKIAFHHLYFSLFCLLGLSVLLLALFFCLILNILFYFVFIKFMSIVSQENVLLTFNVTFHREKMTKDFFKFIQALKKVNLSKWLLLRSVFFPKNIKFDWLNSCVRTSNQSNLRFLVKNTLLNNSHLERFNTVCTLFPMKRHKCNKDTSKSHCKFL